MTHTKSSHNCKLFPSLALAVIFLFCCSKSFANTNRNLTIFAEPKMSLAITNAARLYSQKHNIVVAANFGTFATLLEDIDEGDPIDIFISSNPDAIETLRQRGLADVYNMSYVASSKQDKINYHGIVIAGNNMESAREFLKFLKSEPAKNILKEGGFIVE